MTGPIRETTGERVLDVFVESPTRPGKTAIEVVVGVGSSQQANIEIRNASETISALKCVFAVNANSIAIAENDSTFQRASVFGLAITAANINQSMQIQTFGVLRDSSFLWPANTPLYLDPNGSLTDTAPTTGFRCLVANSQGPGQIFINIQEIITL